MDPFKNNKVPISYEGGSNIGKFFVEKGTYILRSIGKRYRRKYRIILV